MNTIKKTLQNNQCFGMERKRRAVAEKVEWAVIDILETRVDSSPRLKREPFANRPRWPERHSTTHQ